MALPWRDFQKDWWENMVTLLENGPAEGPRFLFAHGAGAPMDSPWMERMAGLLAEGGVRVIRFEFAYMAARRAGKRAPPPRMEKLLDEFRAVISQLGPGPLAIGGKSMGGRAASLIADEMRAQGLARKLVVFGYPFHPAGKPEETRTAHLGALVTPMVIFQGERDALGAKDEVKAYALSNKIRLTWLADGDHDLKPRVASGHTWKENMTLAAARAAEFIRA